LIGLGKILKNKSLKSAMEKATLTPLQKLLLKNSLSPEERERHKQGQQRLKERLQHMPFYASKVAKHGESYWERLHASQINT
jgi:hypothetical protein